MLLCKAFDFSTPAFMQSPPRCPTPAIPTATTDTLKFLNCHDGYVMISKCFYGARNGVFADTGAAFRGRLNSTVVGIGFDGLTHYDLQQKRRKNLRQPRTEISGGRQKKCSF